MLYFYVTVDFTFLCDVFKNNFVEVINVEYAARMLPRQVIDDEG